MRTPSTSTRAGSSASATRSSPAVPGKDPMTVRIGINPIICSDGDTPLDPARAHPLPCATMGHRDLADSLSEAGLR